MGRYYSGDIEGKFWFGVQDSDDASFFGVEASEPTTINYYFSEDNLLDVKTGIEKCLTALGDSKAIIDAFFAEGGEGHTGYNDEMLAKHLPPDTDVPKMLEWYARLSLGRKIEKCLEEHGECSFDAEL